MPTEPLDEKGELEKFETWAIIEAYDLCTGTNGEYEDYESQEAWKVWQARARLDRKDGER